MWFISVQFSSDTLSSFHFTQIQFSLKEQSFTSLGYVRYHFVILITSVVVFITWKKFQTNAFQHLRGERHMPVVICDFYLLFILKWFLIQYLSQIIFIYILWVTKESPKEMTWPCQCLTGEQHVTVVALMFW